MKTAFLLSIALAAAEAPAPQWPPAPAPARLRYAGEIRGAKVQAAGKLGGFMKALLGLDPAGELAGERLVKPTGVCVRGGMVFVADPGARAVLRYREKDGKGEWWPKGSAARLLSPVSVAAADDGSLFVLDSMLRKVLILDAEGKVTGELEGDPQGVGQPASVAVSGSRVFVSDVKDHRIGVYDLKGTFLQAFGRRGVGDGEFNFPTYLWFDRKSDQLWVSDSGNFRIQWFDAEGRFLGKEGENGNRPGYLARPRGLARDSDGHVYAADAAFDAVQVFEPNGAFLLFVGRAGGAPGEFGMPGGVFIDESDRVFVADTGNSRVQVFQYIKEAKP